MIMKIVIILMERMRTNEDVLHLGHSGSAGRPRGTVCLHTTTGETGGGLRPARGNTHYLQEHTHNSNTRAVVSQIVLIWFKHNYIHGALFISLQSIINLFALPQLLQYFLSFFTIADPDLLGPSQFFNCFKSRSLLQILSIPLLHCTVSTFWLVAAEGVLGAPSCW